jgi:hypothetical protein
LRSVGSRAALGCFATLLAALPGAFADGEREGVCYTAAAQLDSLSVCQLDQLFAGAGTGPIPLGYARGHVLLMTDARHPRMRARLVGLAWKGKHFAPDGSFVNQWPGFRAVRAQAVCGPSWFDGEPCLAVDYPDGAPVFGNTRDELRQIGPGLYLGRLYERCPCPRFRGYFAIEVNPCLPCPAVPAQP